MKNSVNGVEVIFMDLVMEAWRMRKGLVMTGGVTCDGFTLSVIVIDIPKAALTAEQEGGNPNEMSSARSLFLRLAELNPSRQ